MNGPPSREEIDAKLDVVRMSSEVFFARMDERCARMDARCDRMEAKFAADLEELRAWVKTALAQLLERVDARLAKLHRTMIVTAITSTLTIILGVGAINATVFTGMIAAMDTGKEVGTMLSKLERRMQEQDAAFNRTMAAQAAAFAKMRADLDAQLENERLARERAYAERRQQEAAEREKAEEEFRKKVEAAERAHQQRMRALRAGQ